MAFRRLYDAPEARKTQQKKPQNLGDENDNLQEILLSY